MAPLLKLRFRVGEGEVLAEDRSPEPAGLLLPVALGNLGFLLQGLNRRCTLHDKPLHDLGPGQDTRLDKETVRPIAIQRRLHEREIEAEAAVALHEVDDLLRPLPNAIADDEQQKLATSQMARDVVDELGFDDVRVPPGDQFVEDVGTLPAKGQGDLTLQVLVVPRSEVLRVVEDLADHLSPRLRVAPQFELAKRQPTQSVDVQRVDAAGRHRKLSAHRNRVGVRRVDRSNRETLGMVEEKLLQGRLVDASFRDTRAQG